MQQEVSLVPVAKGTTWHLRVAMYLTILGTSAVLELAVGQIIACPSPIRSQVELLEKCGSPNVIAIDKGYVFATSSLDAYVSGNTWAAVLRSGQEAETSIALGICLCNGNAIVLTMIIDKEHLEILHRLSTEAVDAVTDVGGYIIYRRDDRNHFLRFMFFRVFE